MEFDEARTHEHLQETFRGEIGNLFRGYLQIAGGLRQSRSQYIVLINIWLLGFSMWVTLLSISPIMPQVKDELGLNFAQTALIFSIPLAMLALLAVFGGFVADRIGPRNAAGIGALLFSVGAASRAVSYDIVTLALFTAIIGLGLALSYPNLPKIIGMWFPPNLFGTASGIYGTGIMIGSTVALALTVPLIYPITGNWRGVFLAWGALSVALTAIWWLTMRSPATSAISDGPPKPGTEAILRVLRNRSLWVIAALLFLVNIIFYVEVTWLLPFFTEMGIGIQDAAILESLVAVAGVPGIIIIPVASDRLKRRKPFLWVSGIVSGVAALALTFSPPMLLYVLAIILGITVIAIYVMCLILPVDLFPRDLVGTASGLVISLGYVGGLIGPFAAGYLADFTGSFSFIPVFLTSVSGLTALVSLIFLRGLDRARAPTS